MSQKAVSPIYFCVNEAQAPEGAYAGSWSGSAIDFVIQDRPVQIQTHGGTLNGPPLTVMVLMIHGKVLVYPAALLQS